MERGKKMNEPMTWAELMKIRARLEEGSLQVATTWPTILVMADRIGPEAETSVQLLAPDFMLSGMIGAAATSMYKVMGGQELTDEDRREPECAAVLAANEVLGLGQGRVVEFVMALCRHILDWQEAISEDRADDPEIAFAKERIDRLLRPIYGDWMPEFDVRYGLAPAPQEKLNVPEKQLAGVRRKEQERQDRALRRAEGEGSE